VRRIGAGDARLHVGMATDLRMRVRSGLIKGQVPHSTGERIRATEDVRELEVRWAEVALEDARLVEEMLKWRHRQQNEGASPSYGKW
jgi:hypothetical protein